MRGAQLIERTGLQRSSPIEYSPRFFDNAIHSAFKRTSIVLVQERLI
jgi:hypothetical protein